VIEDEVKLAMHLSRALESEGHEARVVHDGKVALVEARDGNYERLVLDVELPRMDGFEILNTIDLAVRFWFRPKSMITLCKSVSATTDLEFHRNAHQTFSSASVAHEVTSRRRGTVSG
jgi:CheY-like chemotaxis protein